MLVKSVGVIVSGSPETGLKYNPARRPFEMNDEEALAHVANGSAQPHGEAAEKALAALKEKKARERVRLAQEWAPDDDERDDEPVEDRAKAAEEARRMELLHNREQEQAAARQKVAQGDKGKPDKG
jgi:hypothetical protein